jgi:hypothetical protein
LTISPSSSTYYIIVGATRANFYSQEKTLAGKKTYCTATLARALLPRPFALWVRRLFNHCFHLLGGELALQERKKEKKMRKKREKRKR